MPPELNDIIAQGTAPVSEDTPTGINIQDDLIFDQIQRDVQMLLEALGSTAELPAIGDSEPPTWERVADQSFELIKKSKDFRVVSFLALAMTHTRGFEGLAACLEMLHGMMSTFWDTMFPPLKLLRGRVNALTFMATKIAGESEEPGGRIRMHQEKLIEAWDELGKTNPTVDAGNAMLEQIEAQTEGLRRCTQSNEKLREIIYDKIPSDKLPSISSLNQAIKDALALLEDFLKRNKPEPPAEGAEGAPGGAAAQTAPAGAVQIESADDVRRVLARCIPVLRQANMTDPAPYRISRWVAWGGLVNPPPTTDGQKTRIPDVQKNEVDQVQAMLASSNWLQLLNQCEERFPQTPLWLDRQYCICQALGGLGAAYEAAAAAVRDELGNLIRRLPDLPSYQFANGMPLADPTTQAWIQNEVLAAGGDGKGGGGGAAASSATGADGALSEALNEAREMIKDGKLVEAIRRLEKGPPGPQSGRARFLWRLAQTQLAQESGRARQILPVYESLVEQIDRHQLEDWEPELCLKVFRELWRLLKTDKTRAEQATQALHRLCRIDPAAALEG